LLDAWRLSRIEGGKFKMGASSSKRKKTKKTPAPGKTIEAREAQLINLAADLAEKQLRDGTASSQVMTHFLKLGSTRNRSEMQKLETENKLLAAKIESLESSKRVEELYKKALQAMREYSGNLGEEDDELED
jgi:hypothetical protein